MNKFLVTALTAAMAFGSAAFAQHEGPLVDALVKKGVLTSQEGEDIRAELTSEFASLPAGKLDLGANSSITKLKIYGDVRLRYQYTSVDTFGANTSAQNSAYRYRVRVGADYTFVENFKAGLRVSTQEGQDSTNADFGNFFDKATGEDNLFIDLAYLQYSADDLFELGLFDEVDFRVGKHKHPFFLNSMFWDSDTNPEGISEQFGWEDVVWDGFDVTLRGGQYIISTENNNTANASDDFLFVGQLEGKYSWAKKEHFRIAPMFMHSDGGSQAGTESTNTSDGTPFDGGTFFGSFTVFMLPAEVTWKAFDLPWTVYGTYGINVDSDTTARGAGNQMAQLGLKVGSAKKKGSWQAYTDFNYVEAGAYTENLMDSDFHGGNTGGIGYRLGAKYAFTDFLTGGVTWLHSWEVNSDLGGTGAATGAFGTAPGSGGGAANDVRSMLQVDLAWKF